MSEKRKPEAVIVARIRGKTIKIELFENKLWPRLYHRNQWGKYRVRFNGRWLHPRHSFTITFIAKEFRRLLVRELKERRVHATEG